MGALKECCKEWSGALIGLAMFAVGVFGIWRCTSDLGHSLSETAFVAGLVTFTVDPFVKRRLIREAGKDIFRHLLGVELPLDVREAMQDHLFNTKVFSEEVHIDADVATQDDDVLVTVTMRSKIVAIKDHDYEQGVAFEASEHGRLLEAGMSGHSDPAKDYQKGVSELPLTIKSNEPMVEEWKGPKIPVRKGDRLGWYIKYQVKRARLDHYVSNFGSPAIRPTVRLSGSNDLEITASTGNRQIGETYLYDKVFLSADHIIIRWQPK